MAHGAVHGSSTESSPGTPIRVFPNSLSPGIFSNLFRNLCVVRLLASYNFETATAVGNREVSRHASKSIDVDRTVPREAKEEADVGPIERILDEDRVSGTLATNCLVDNEPDYSAIYDIESRI
ncbi:hypothetical protein V1477_018975 [Vespula maculifrons]|uniref:Uncharacterized protein n=1 Tax=Vespula maculifrons TaxID=7453 RepID=A0ABD2ASZ1_VESMC